jgi:nitrate/TMAO reductase-like tetraheme cytochrome c subunit
VTGEIAEETLVKHKRTFFRGMARAPSHAWTPGVLSILCLSLWSFSAAAQVEDSCVDCHSNPRLLVTNKKLYDYYQEWSNSIHKQEEVSCVDCHGGDSDAPGKTESHGGDLSGTAAGSAVNFQHIPSTCGECHDEIYEAFRTSEHFEHVLAKEEDEQGPTCVTCHGSINAQVLNVETVGDSCARCHNEESDNHPENPDKARKILNKFLSIHRFYRYVTVRASPNGSQDFFKELDTQLKELTLTWHTFDLEEIEKRTGDVLDVLKAKRNEVRARR